MKVKQFFTRLFGGANAPSSEDSQKVEPIIDPTPSEIAKLRASDEPWVMVVGEGEEDGRIKLQLDWNEAFISYLLESGITGHNDDEIVAKWVGMLDQKILLGMEDTKE